MTNSIMESEDRVEKIYGFCLYIRYKSPVL